MMKVTTIIVVSVITSTTTIVTINMNFTTVVVIISFAIFLQATIAKHDASPAEVRRPAKVGDEQRDVKKVAAQLFRAFDEGRLRERAAAPADQTGELARALC